MIVVVVVFIVVAIVCFAKSYLRKEKVQQIMLFTLAGVIKITFMVIFLQDIRLHYNVFTENFKERFSVYCLTS